MSYQPHIDTIKIMSIIQRQVYLAATHLLRQLVVSHDFGSSRNEPDQEPNVAQYCHHGYAK